MIFRPLPITSFCSEMRKLQTLVFFSKSASIRSKRPLILFLCRLAHPEDPKFWLKTSSTSFLRLKLRLYNRVILSIVSNLEGFIL